MDNPVSRPQTDVQALKRAARLLRVHVRTKEGDDLAVKLETLAAPADSTARPSYTKTEQDLWLALGKWSIEICRPDVELAPPRYLIDAVRDLSAQPAEPKQPEPVAWMYEQDGGEASFETFITRARWMNPRPGVYETPLYAAPPAAEPKQSGCMCYPGALEPCPTCRSIATEPKDEQVERLKLERQLARFYDTSNADDARLACAGSAIAMLRTRIATLTAERDQLKRERDLAIAHDTQPYPTAWAYEQACKKIADLERQLAEARKLIDEHNKDCAMMCGEGEQEGVRCKYRPYFPRHCPECPRDLMIEIPLAASLQPAGPTLTEDKTA